MSTPSGGRVTDDKEYPSLLRAITEGRTLTAMAYAQAIRKRHAPMKASEVYAGAWAVVQSSGRAPGQAD